MLSAVDDLFGELRNTRIDSTPRRFGRLVSCDGGLLDVVGLAVPIGTLCRLDHHQGQTLSAEVVGFRDGHSLMLLLDDPVLIRPGSIVRAEGRPGLVGVGEQYLGRAVDGAGLPIDGGAPIVARHHWPVGGERRSALDRSPVREQFDCGVRPINALATMGVGQRMGIVAGSGVGKSVLLDMIASHAEAEIVIVGLIGERAREVSDFVERHMVGEKLARTVVIAVPADHAPNLRLRGAMLATAMAEYFRASGRKVLLIMDSLTRVAHAAREVGLVLGEPAAARGYPPSALTTLTKLIERAGNCAISAGSITGIYTVLADGDDQDDPVVDTARAILDGHLVLSRALAQRGQYPAIDIAASLSRVMSDVTTPAHIVLARRFRALSASFEANRDLVLMGAYREGADRLLDEAIKLNAAMTAILCQEVGTRVDVEQSIVALGGVIRDER